MGKELWKPGNMLYPLPAVMVSLADQEGHPNIITLAWVGTVAAAVNSIIPYLFRNRGNFRFRDGFPTLWIYGRRLKNVP